MLVVGVEKQKTVVGSEVVVQLALGLLYSLEGAEALQVGTSDIRYHTACRLSVVDELLDVAGMACSHLNDGNVVAGIHAQQGLGYSNIVVEVALGVHDVVLLGQYRCH